MHSWGRQIAEKWKYPFSFKLPFGLLLLSFPAICNGLSRERLNVYFWHWGVGPCISPLKGISILSQANLEICKDQSDRSQLLLDFLEEMNHTFWASLLSMWLRCPFAYKNNPSTTCYLSMLDHVANDSTFTACFLLLLAYRESRRDPPCGENLSFWGLEDAPFKGREIP